jgi:hypothetical protein
VCDVQWIYAVLDIFKRMLPWRWSTLLQAKGYQAPMKPAVADQFDKSNFGVCIRAFQIHQQAIYEELNCHFHSGEGFPTRTRCIPG